MNNYCVYRHTSPSGKVYIGITSQKPQDRWDSGHGYKANRHFSNAIKKYGWSNIAHDVLFEGLSQKEAEGKEVELIALYNSSDRKYGYNIALGGRVHNVSEETRMKLSASHKGKKLSQAQRAKMSESRRGEKHPMYGKHHTEESRRKMSEAHKGRSPWCAGLKLTDEHKAKLSMVRMGHKVTDETIAKWRKSNHFRMRPVEQIDVQTGQVVARFSSTADAFRNTGIDASAISKCCRNKRKTASGFKWRYAIETQAS